MKNIIISIKAFIGFSILLGLIYPLAITGIAQVAFPQKANGSLIIEKGQVIGSSLIGQKFDKPEYFHSRPSAVDYNAASSGASNLGPTSKKLAQRVKDTIKKENLSGEKIPPDMVLTSASGLDPHISLKNAQLQIPRISKNRNIPETKLKELVNKNTDSDLIGLWGGVNDLTPAKDHSSFRNCGVNVLKLNIALDKEGK